MVESRNRRRKRLLGLLTILAIVLAALFLIRGVPPQYSLDTSYTFLDDIYVRVLIVTVLTLVVLLWFIAHRLIVLLRRVRAQEPGARLSARWVRNFLMLSLPPALVVYFFSAWFLTRTVDNWFDVRWKWR